MDTIIICAGIVVIGVMAIAAAFVIRSCSMQDEETPMPESEGFQQAGWYIELWDMQNRRPLKCCFGEWVILGRGIPGYVEPGKMAIGDSITISRRQCAISTDRGYLAIWNMAKVNPTLLNGQTVDNATVLHEGDRLVCGDCSYIVTVIRYSNVDLNF